MDRVKTASNIMGERLVGEEGMRYTTEQGMISGFQFTSFLRCVRAKKVSSSKTIIETSP